MKKRTKIFIAAVCIVLCSLLVAAIIVNPFNMIIKSDENFTIGCQQLDLSVKSNNIPEELQYLFEFSQVDKIDGYLAHPDSVLLNDGSVLQVYPKGHGKGAILTKLSFDGGLTYSDSLQNTPQSWDNSKETPTIYRLKFTDGVTTDKLILTSANPDWHDGNKTTGGFNCSVSTDEGKTWTEFSLFYPKGDENGVVPIVAMASLTQLKENGQFVDKWMGFFHDAQFNNYKSILTFDNDGNPQWSAPEKYFSQYEKTEKKSQMCEVEVVRSDEGKGDELCLLTRSNSKKMNSLVSFSQDEGETWSEPKELPACLNGERLKAEYSPDGRLVIVFRSIGRNPELLKQYYSVTKSMKFYSNGPVMWVGTYNDLKNGTDGQYRIKLAHTYLSAQSEPQFCANGDTGYCGNTVLADGTFVISTYGCFSPDEKYTDEKGNEQLKTYIISKRINLNDIDRLAQLQKS